jgi:hypothetical protein
MAKYPKDRFDDIPVDLARVGAHRAPARAGRGWITFAWAALFTGLFVLIGVLGLNLLNGQGFFDDGGPTAAPTTSSSPTAEPVIDPTAFDPARAITITVLNATPTVDLETAAGNALRAAGWPVGTFALASDRTIKKTIVYYSNPADEDVARGLVLALGTGDVLESTAFLGAPVTVVLGSDYVAPAA